MNFYLFKLRVSTGASDKSSCYQRDGIIAAETMEEAFCTINNSCLEDPLKGTAINLQLVFIGGGGDDDICDIGTPEYDCLKEFFQDRSNNR